MAHQGRYPRRIEPRHSMDQCSHPHCVEKADPFEFPDGAPAGRLCWKHAAEHGFCGRCGNFVAGSSDDITLGTCGMCSECWDEWRSDCGEDYDDWDDDSGFDELDEYELALQECGQQRYGGCLNAGTEYCDFDCPFRDIDLFEDD